MSGIIKGTVNVLNKASMTETGFDYKILDYHVIAARGNIIYAKNLGNNVIYKSTDNGTTWTLIATMSTWISTAHLTSAGVLIVFLGDSTVWRSVNDAAFAQVAGLTCYAPLQNGIDSNGAVICFGEYTIETGINLNIYRSSDGGVTFTAVLTKAAPSEVTHFHTVKYFSEQAVWIATSGDTSTTSMVWSSSVGSTWSLAAIGTKYRMVGVSMIAPKTLVWGADMSTDTFIYAGALDAISATTRKIGTLPGFCLGIAGNKNVLMLVTRVENSINSVDLINCVYVSYDSGRTWEIEHTVTARASGSGFVGILGPDADGCFYLSAVNIEEAVATTYVTVRCMPKVGYKKKLAPLDYSYTKRSYSYPVLTANAIRQNTGIVYGAALPFAVHNPVLVVRNTLDQSAVLRLGDGQTGNVTDSAGTVITSTFASDTGNTKAVTIDASILKLNPIPAGFFVGAYCGTAPTAGGITITLYGEVYEPTDHRLLP